MTAPQTQLHLAKTPRAADLVQNLEDGSYCLRIHHDGHMWWRQLDGRPDDRIPATGIWSADSSFLRHYWTYLGTMRLAQGAYRLVQPAPLAG